MLRLWKKGHFSDFCPETKSGQAHLQCTEIPEDETNENIVEDDDQQHLIIDDDDNDSEESSECRSDESSIIVDFQAFHNHTFLSQKYQGEVDKDTSILIDTGSTCSVFNNEKC